MIAYVALLRGINVGGRTKVRMADLQGLVAGLGHTDVSTYIQSGNVVFRSADADAADVARGIETAIAQKLGLTVTVLLRSREDLAAIAAGNPFLDRGADPASLHVTFLAETPEPAAIEALKIPDAGHDQFHLDGRDVYLHTPDGYGRTKLNNGFWERKLRVAATTRNWNTVLTLLRLAGE